MRKLKKSEIKDFKAGTRSILTAAFENNIEVYRFLEEERIFILKKGTKWIWFRGPRLSVSNPVSLWIIKDKYLTKTVLEETGVPYPKGWPATTIDEAIAISKKVGFPLVMKPRRSENGQGVFLHIDSEEKIKKFFRCCAYYDSQVLLEQEAQGKYYRITMVGSKVAGILETSGIILTADGKSAIKEIINSYNKTSPSRYKITKKTKDILSFQGLTLSSVPPKKTEIMLGFSGAEGGYWIDRTDEICRENAALLAKLTKTLELNVVGIDLIAKNISLPINSKKSPGYVLEINGAPEFTYHMKPTHGKPRDIGRDIIDMLFNK